MASARNRRRWSDNDRYWGPLTLSTHSVYRPLEAVLFSGDDEQPDAAGFRVSLRGATAILALPGWAVRPARTWRTMSPAVSGCGEAGYWQVTQREFGFSLDDGGGQVGSPWHLSLRYGAQTGCWPGEASWGCFLPWTDWRHVRRTLYDQHCRVHANLYDHQVNRVGDRGYEEAMVAECPVRRFTFTDFDGEKLDATVRLEEREWRAGTGWFTWLGRLRRPIVQRYIAVDFSGETGRRKGSWKGGTISHSGPCEVGLTHEQAFRAYCLAHEMTFMWEFAHA